MSAAVALCGSSSAGSLQLSPSIDKIAMICMVALNRRIISMGVNGVATVVVELVSRVVDISVVVVGSVVVVVVSVVVVVGSVVVVVGSEIVIDD